MQKICLLTNYNLYESKRHFTLMLAQALQKRKIETKVLDVQEGVLGADMLNAIRQFAPDLTCSFNSLQPISENQFLWDFLEIPHLSILLDPVLYSVNLVNSPYSIISCVDRFDIASIPSHFTNHFFWPHAIEKELCEEPLNKEKDLEVVFLGSCYDYESLRATWQQKNKPEFNKVLDDAIEIFFSNPFMPLSEALVSAWNLSTLPHNGVDFLTLFYYLDYYTRGKDRMDLIRSIKDVKVHVFGEMSTDVAGSILGWPQYLDSQNNVVLHPSVSYQESLNILKRSKICLNSMPFFKNGSHERIFAGLACGSLPMTTANLYIQEQFKEGESILFYENKKMSEINGKINFYLKNEENRKQAVQKGQEIVKKHHTWDNRADQLLEQLPTILKKINLH